MLEQKFADNLNNILKVNEPKKIAIAVSGGSDSISLLHLAFNWARQTKIAITVFSVDHNLRPESKLELAYVEKLSKKLGAHFVPLFWQNNNQPTAIQERAREARYNLITEHCKKLGIKELLTAHHLDDALETYLIKKSKKTSALALKPNITYFWNNIWIMRPLFDITKQELVDYLLKNKIKWFEDSSNNSDKYERNRVRKTLNNLSNQAKSKLLSEYNAAVNKAEKLNDLLIKSFAETVAIYNEGFAKIDINKFNFLEEEIKIHLLNYVLTIVGGKNIIPRYRSLEKIILAIADNNFKAGTLSQCCLRLKDGVMLVFREKSSVIESEARQSQEIGDKHYPQPNGIAPRLAGARNDADCYLWDNRFEIINLPSGYFVSHLSTEDYSKLKKLLNLKKLAKDSNNNHKSILFTLPVIKNLEKVIAIPHISYYDTSRAKDIKVIFKPNFISRFTHFF
jgi:tRNA(Ile)-lysidine synthase